MTVIDLRDELYTRRIEIIEITDDFIYYAEELKVNDIDTVYVYGYNFAEENEQVMSYFTFDDATYLQHFYACKDSIIVLFENDGNKAWVVKIDKRTGDEVLRKTVPLIGRFADCVPIDDDNIIIYTKADEAKRELFNRCLETTNSDTMANLYDLKENRRYFVRDFHTALLIKNNMHRFSNSNGKEYMLLCDPYSDEISKEELFKDSDGIENDIRDNIWMISTQGFLNGVKNGCESLKLKRIASAGTDGMVRFECISRDNIVFRAKTFSTGYEKFCAMSTVSGEILPVANVKKRNDEACYFTDNNSGKIYYMTRDDNSITLNGEINSQARITYPGKIGNLESCIDDRFIIADNSVSYDEPILSIYDGRLNLTDTYQARAKTRGEILVFF